MPDTLTSHVSFHACRIVSSPVATLPSIDWPVEVARRWSETAQLQKELREECSLRTAKKGGGDSPALLTSAST